MKKHIRIISCLLALILAVSSVACSQGNMNTSSAVAKEETKTDLWRTCLENSSFKDKFDGFETNILGSYPFSDYTELHSSPLKTASYVTAARSSAWRIEKDASGLVDFERLLLTNYGYHLESCEYELPSSKNVSDIFLKICSEFSDGNDYTKQAKKLSYLTSRTKSALCDYLRGVYAAMLLNRDAVSLISEDEYESLLAFSYCLPATDDEATLSRLREMVFAADAVALQKLLLSGYIMTNCTVKLSASLSSQKKFTSNGSALTINSPLGDLVFGSSDADSYTSPDALLILDPGGNDLYRGRIASGKSFKKPISVLIDFNGNDRYEAGSEDGATQGCGVFGTGILFDMKGNDSYNAHRTAQGCALIGTGILFDGQGDDIYTSKFTSQGSGYFGTALCVDAKGNDLYEILTSGQGYGGCGAVSMLVDNMGNDIYNAKKDVDPDYLELSYEHSAITLVNSSWSQGCGAGQRNVNLSGGVGAVIDQIGDDCYFGGVWSMGTGYWNGVGFLSDGQGDDKYSSQYYSQASVAHFGIAALIDEDGNDLHDFPDIGRPSGQGAGLSFVWDRGFSLLIDDGGNDKYTGNTLVAGSSYSAYDPNGLSKQDMNYAIFIDTGGDDKYDNISASVDSFGYGNGGFFIDMGGYDLYPDARWNDILIKADAEGLLENGVFYDYGGDKMPYIEFWMSAKAKKSY